ncbi:hypothetical protein QG37_08007 [Candidozyma auris]|uniref:Uncharacterized protein n=1 Tax=Candidozyma auris TaxID=498019 RepID=A0A0L0NNG5_CANAR|nr:hypothetical protein QG37_08007 [[Candida] auris]
MFQELDESASVAMPVEKHTPPGTGQKRQAGMQNDNKRAC